MLPQGELPEEKSFSGLEGEGTPTTPTTPSLVGAPPKVEDTVTKQNTLAPKPGELGANPANKSTIQGWGERLGQGIRDRVGALNPKNKTKDIGSAVANKLGGENSAVGKTAKKATNAVQTGTQAARALSGDVTAIAALSKKALAWASQPENRQKLIALMIIFSLPLLLSSFAVGFALSEAEEGDHPTGVAVSGASIYGGVHCAGIMQPSLDVTYHGKTFHLTLSSTEGGFTSEKTIIDPVNIEMINDAKTGREGLTFSSQFKAARKANPSAYPDWWLDYYVTSRWPGISWGWSGGAKFNPPGIEGQSQEGYNAYGMRRIVIYNPKTDKAVLGIALEAGNAPYVNVGSKFTESDWGGYRATDPPGYTDAGGLVVGGPGRPDSQPSLQKDLGFNFTSNDSSDAQGQHVVFGFAPPELQDHAPGPIECKVVDESKSTGSGNFVQKDVVDDRSKNVTGTPHIIDGIPGVRQKDSNDCNKAAAATVLLYYSKDNAEKSKEVVKKFTEINSSGQLVNGPGCDLDTASIMTSGLQGITNSGSSVIFKKVTHRPSKEEIRASIDRGDPVIIAQNGLVSEGDHFVVITGYDDKTFFIHDPYPWDSGSVTKGDIHIYTNKGHTSSHTVLSQDTLVSHLSDTNHYFAIMRQP